jgi:hypothetical protein
MLSVDIPANLLFMFAWQLCRGAARKEFVFGLDVPSSLFLVADAAAF